MFVVFRVEQQPTAMKDGAAITAIRQMSRRGLRLGRAAAEPPVSKRFMPLLFGVGARYEFLAFWIFPGVAVINV